MKMKKYGVTALALLATTLLAMPAGSSAQQVIKLYQGKPAGSESWTWAEAESPRNGFSTRLIYNVSEPTLTVYLPEASKANGTGIIVAPGGAFHILSIDNEGIDVARWLNTHGIAAFVLKYRLVKSETNDPVKELMPLMGDFKKLDAINEPVVKMAMQDGLVAMKFVRSHASDYRLTPNRIGFMGFSAGGTVTMSVVNNASDETRPSFVAPVYAYAGAIIGNEVPKARTPIFVAAASDDQLGLASHSVGIYSKWLAAGQPAALHMYEKGGHGFGMAKHGVSADDWIIDFGNWLKHAGLMPDSSTVAKPTP